MHCKTICLFISYSFFLKNNWQNYSLMPLLQGWHPLLGQYWIFYQSPWNNLWKLSVRCMFVFDTPSNFPNVYFHPTPSLIVWSIAFLENPIILAFDWLCRNHFKTTTFPDSGHLSHSSFGCVTVSTIFYLSNIASEFRNNS